MTDTIETHRTRIKASVERQMESTLTNLPQWIDDIIKDQAYNLAAQIMGARFDTFSRKLQFDNGRYGKIGEAIQAQAHQRAVELLTEALPTITLTDIEKRAIAKSYRQAYLHELKELSSTQGIQRAQREIDRIVEGAIEMALADPVETPEPDDIAEAIDRKLDT